MAQTAKVYRIFLEYVQCDTVPVITSQTIPTVSGNTLVSDRKNASIMHFSETV